MYNKTSKIMIYLENHMEDLYRIFLGDTIDEYNEPYVKVYKGEISSFLNRIESNLNRLEKVNILLNKENISEQIILNWGCGREDELDNKAEFTLNDFIDNLLNEIYSDEQKLNHGLEITESERLYIQKELFSQNHNDKMTLVALILEKEDDPKYKLFQYFKETDLKHYESLVQSTIEDYINSTNILYKLCGSKPALDDSLHKGIYDNFGIKREEFVF
jgi:hypothetical protein